MQVPLTQLGVPAEQTTPQAPQFVGSMLVSVQTPLQTVLPVGHTQEPLEQIQGPAPQLLPQAPQLVTSLLVSVQAPLQRVWPATGQGEQVPLTQ